MITDPVTIRFLLTVCLRLVPIVLVAIAVAIPLLIVIWRLDPFRVRRLSATAGAVGCLVGLYAVETLSPMGEYEGFYGENYVSHFARSGVDALSARVVQGWSEADLVA